jgi:hypothetical protein
VVFRECTPDVAEMILALKEVVKVDNVWTRDAYVAEHKKLLGKRAMTDQELQARRGFYVIDNAASKQLIE